MTKPAVDSDYMFAFAGEVEWLDDRDNMQVNKEITGKRLESLRERKESSGGRRPSQLSHYWCGVQLGPGATWTLKTGSQTAAQREDRVVVGSVIRQEEKDAGPINDTRTRIRLDTGANVSVVSASYAKQLRLCDVPDHGRSLEITIGWERPYEFEMWILDHSAGVDVVLGTDFMILAGVRLDLFHGTTRLPDEVMIPLIKPSTASDDESYGTHVAGGPTEDLCIPGYAWREFKLPMLRPSLTTHEVWIRRTSRLVLTVTKYRRGQPTWILLTNITSKLDRCGKHDAVALWIPKGELPRNSGYARSTSNKYKEWQVLSYAESKDVTLFEREQKIYEKRVAEQPPLVDEREYSTPKHILTRGVGGEDSDSLEQPWMDPVQIRELATDAYGHRRPLVVVTTQREGKIASPQPKSGKENWIRHTRR
ncbi:hypothetical protein PHMEG_00022035 [Phytophthora megakarya]|uniref:Peptidase A2 domain-containing protein n=1 Tax=Phytophthora megakarya TaxID=4795 RepID=A0A225VKE5_9STRA|nr:hypothetical protein PHMEG_00022035 [Phytophthora megakarya]